MTAPRLCGGGAVFSGRALEERGGAQCEAFRQSADMTSREFAFTSKDFGDDTLRADLRQLALSQTMLIHEKSQKIRAVHFALRVVLPVVGVDEIRQHQV